METIGLIRQPAEINGIPPVLVPAEGLGWKNITVHENVTTGSCQEINPIIAMLNNTSNRGFVSLAVSRPQSEPGAIRIAYSDQSRTYNRLVPASQEQLFRVNLRKDEIDGKPALRLFFVMNEPGVEELTTFLDSFLLNLSRTALDSGLLLEANFTSPANAEKKTQLFTSESQLNFPAKIQAERIQRLTGLLKQPA